MDARSESWFVLLVTSGQETPVSKRLDRLALEYFLPMRTVRTVHKRYKMDLVRQRPAFPGYMFTREPANWRAVKETEGVLRYLELDDKPEPIPAKDMATVMSACASGLHDECDPILRALMANDRVTANVGPLLGCTGTVVAVKGKNALRVAFDTMAQLITVPIDMVDFVSG